jgi:hypothetical protein
MATWRAAGSVSFDASTAKACADQQRGRFVVGDVDGRFAAAQVVVVHAGHVVVDQRIGVDHLDRAGGTRQGGRLGAEQRAAGIHQ